MPTFAHITADTIDALGQPPDLVYHEGRWYDLRDLDPATLAIVGWLPVTETPRPADTDTTTHDYAVTLVAGIPTETWTERPWTQAELDARAAEAVAVQLEADTAADLTKLRQTIDDLQLLLGDDVTVGSIRNIIGPVGSAAGTTTLRALKAQSNTAVVSAASIKGLIDRVIDLAQLNINDVQATKRTARQVLRLAKDMVGDYGSADVGTE